jgi:AcrR family transcriptional regulator
MARARNGKTRAQMEADIVKAATALFARRGYYSPTLREISAQADVSLPIIYWFFKDKRDLYVECCVRAVKTDVEGLREAIEPYSDAAEIAFAYATKHCRYHLEGDATKLLHQILLYNDKVVLKRVAKVLFNAQGTAKASEAFGKLEPSRSPEWSMFILVSFFAGLIEHSTQWAFLGRPGQTPKIASAREYALRGLPVLFPKVDWEAVSERMPKAPPPKKRVRLTRA